MGKKNKAKANSSSDGNQALPSEEKTPTALKPVSKITKTPTQKTADAKNSVADSSAQKQKVPKKVKKSIEKKAVVVNVKDKKDETKEEVPKVEVKVLDREAEVKVEVKDAGQDEVKVEVKGAGQDEVKVEKINYAGKSDKNTDNKKEKATDAKNKEKVTIDETAKGKLGGLIFMCNARTKPDCYHYMVMGLPDKKKDLVLSIKPGLKLFLYDYDLKVLYGIYKAAGPGGMKLEPAAWGGAYPAQVRFKVDRDCVPIPKNKLKGAIIENFEGAMFKCELTVQQAQKVINLFTTAPSRPKELPVAQSQQIPLRPFAPPMPIVPMQGPPRAPGGGFPAPGAPLASTGRTYGAQLHLPAADPLHHGRPETYRPYDRPAISDPRTNPYGNAAYPAGADRITDRLSYPNSHLAYDPLHSYYSRREADYGTRFAERSRVLESENHSAYAATVLADYTRRQQQPGSGPDITSAPVSSRYAFAGPSFSYK